MRYLDNYQPTPFIQNTSIFDQNRADLAVSFINCLKHTKGQWHGQPFELIDWQEQIIRDLFGILKPNQARQFNTAYVEISKKQGKSELAAAVALLLTCGDYEHGGEIYGCASDRQQASIVFDVAVDMVDQCPALKSRIKPILSRSVWSTNRWVASTRFCLPKHIRNMDLMFMALSLTNYTPSLIEISMMSCSTVPGMPESSRYIF